jgi:L-Ala-D/L-Glu epimerase
MKITSITTTPVRMTVSHAPYKTEGAGSKHHWGKRGRLSPKRPSPVLEYLIVAIHTDRGFTGLGEAPVDIGFFGETLEGVKAAVDDYLGPQLIGQNPFDREHLMSVIDFRGNSCGKAGLDLALHDLIGKSLGVPVTTLLGGKLRSRIPVAVEIAGGTPDEMANECLRFMDLGVRGRPSADAERLRAIRQAVGPTVSIRADANQGYSPKEAIQLCQLAERYGVELELLEQPVPAWDMAGMALVRRSVQVLIEADEGCYTAHDALQLIRHDIKIAKAGGLLHAKKLVAVAEAAGIRCVFGTAFGLGLEMAAKLHLAASTPDTLDAVEFTEIGLHPNLLAPPYDTVFGLPLEDGCLPVPEGPGLGVNLDVGAVQNAAFSPEVIGRA